MSFSQRFIRLAVLGTTPAKRGARLSMAASCAASKNSTSNSLSAILHDACYAGSTYAKARHAESTPLKGHANPGAKHKTDLPIRLIIPSLPVRHVESGTGGFPPSPTFRPDIPMLSRRSSSLVSPCFAPKSLTHQ